MRKVYTKTGDGGTTGIHGGLRVSKTDIRIETNGSLDELNVAIGIACSFINPDSPIQATLKDVQVSLMTIMSRVATPSKKLESNPNPLPQNLVERLELKIDGYNAQCTNPEYFILPGGTQASAFLHECRVRARRAERNLWVLNEVDPVEPQITTYVNRLSDLFFVLARYELEWAGLDEERWQQFSYKHKKE